MPNLEAQVDELIKIFPRRMEGLDVALIINKPEELKFIYVQRETKDARRNWVAYEELQRRNSEYMQRQQGMIKLPLRGHSPVDFDDIYLGSMSYIRDGLISPIDRVLLEVHLIQYTETKEDVIYLTHIQRNRGPDLKRLGEEFYNSMLTWLKKKGYHFLKALPNGPRLNSYWQQLGQVPIASLNVEQREYLTTPKMASNMHVHILS